MLTLASVLVRCYRPKSWGGTLPTDSWLLAVLHKCRGAAHDDSYHRRQLTVKRALTAPQPATAEPVTQAMTELYLVLFHKMFANEYEVRDQNSLCARSPWFSRSLLPIPSPPTRASRQHLINN